MMITKSITSTAAAVILCAVSLSASDTLRFDFEKRSLAGWKVQKGNWKVVKDSTGGNVMTCDTPKGEIILDTKEKFTDFELVAGVRTYKGDLHEQFILRSPAGKDFDCGYRVVLHTAFNDKKRGAYLPKLYLYKDKKVVASGKLMRYCKYEKMLKIRIKAIGNTFEGFIDDGIKEQKIFFWSDEENKYPAGCIGLMANHKTTSHFGNIRITRGVVKAESKELAAYPFEDNFDDLPAGTFSGNQKWNTFCTTKADNKIEVVEEKGRGKVLHVYSKRKISQLIPKINITGIPCIIEFDLKVPAAKASAGEKTICGRMALNFYSDSRAKKNSWVVNFNNYSYTFRVTKTAKSDYRPTQTTGKDWGHVQIKVDGNVFAFSARPESHKNRKETIDYFSIPEFTGRNGFIDFMARPSWHYETFEFWLDNVKIALLPVAERNAYLLKKKLFQEYEKIFHSELFKKAAGDKVPAELVKIKDVLKKTEAISANDIAGYQEALNTLDQMLTQCSAQYRKYETAIFASLFSDKDTYRPLDISAIYNYTPAKRLSAFQSLTPLAEVEKIPFHVSPVSPYAHHFSLDGKSAVRVPVGAKAKEIFLLMMPQWELDFLKNGVYPSISATHNDGPIDRRDLSVAGSSEAIHQAFQVEICYENGETERAVPLLYKKLIPAMDMGKLSVYSIRPSRNYKIASITLYDRMNDWAGTLYAITLGMTPPKAMPQREKLIPSNPVKEGAGFAKIASDRIILESPAYRFSMAKNGVLRFTEMFNKYSARNMLNGNSGALLLTSEFTLAKKYSKLKDDKDGVLIPVNPQSPHFAYWNIRNVKQNSRDTLLFEIENSIKNLTGTLTVKAEMNEVKLTAVLKNKGDKKEKLAVIFPLLKNIIADEYLLPLRNGIVSNRALNYYGEYGSNMYCMMQMISVWDKNQQTSLTMRVEDKNGEMKVFRFYKKHPKIKNLQAFSQLNARNSAYLGNEIGDYGNGILLGVQYYYIEVEAGKGKKLPTVSISVNPGTWKEPLRQYADWLKTWCKPLRPIPEKTRKVALCVTGGGLNEQSKPKSGMEWGGVDLVHLYFIHSLDYLEVIRKNYISNILGAKKNYASRRVPIGLGCYTVEGSYLRTETKLFGDVKHKWSLVNHKGQYSYFQPLTKDQVLICRANKDWQNRLAEQVALVAGETVPTWVYVDTIGVAGPSLCFNAKHDHGDHPAEELRGIAQEMKTISAALMRENPSVGLLTEGPGCDYLTQFRDGAWSSLRGWETVNNPGNIMFFRYTRPTFKFIELGGDSVTRSKINYFNGVPVNIYIYRGEDRTTATLKPLVTGYRKYWDLFTGEDMEPDVSIGDDARKHGVYMNRFGNIMNKRVVFAVANWGYITWKGKLKLDYFPGAKYTVATDQDKVLKHQVLKDKKQAEVSFTIDPYEVAYIAVTKESAQ